LSNASLAQKKKVVKKKEVKKKGRMWNLSKRRSSYPKII
jgi:hypothetical protein